MSTRGPSNRAQKPLANKPKSKPRQSNKPKANKSRQGRQPTGNRSRPRGPLTTMDATTVLQHAAPQLSDVLEKDEYVADVLGSNGVGNVVITKYPFNPAQAALFPLGSAEANKWTHWKCVYAEPYLLHEVSEYATDGSTGKVYLSMDYNAANVVPTTKQQIADMHSASCMPCQDVGLKLIPRLLNRADPKYIRPGLQPADTDIRLYDGGNLYVTAAGQAGNTKISELRIRYKFTLELPTLLNPGGVVSPPNNDVAFFQSSGAETGGASNAYASLLVATATTNGIGAVNTAGSIVLPAGNYRVSMKAVENFSGLSTVDYLDIQKNGASVFVAGYGSATTRGSASVITSPSCEAWVQSNGTDAFTFLYKGTYSTGALSCTGTVLIQSV